MNAHNISIDHLQNLIGHEVSFEGCRCQVIEILEDGPALILQHHERLTTIQPDQHGEAHRRVPSTITIPVIDNKTATLHPDFISLDLTRLL